MLLASLPSSSLLPLKPKAKMVTDNLTRPLRNPTLLPNNLMVTIAHLSREVATAHLSREATVATTAHLSREATVAAATRVTADPLRATVAMVNSVAAMMTIAATRQKRNQKPTAPTELKLNRLNLKSAPTTMETESPMRPTELQKALISSL